VFHNQFLPISINFNLYSIILSPYHSYLLIPFLTLLIYSLNGYEFIWNLEFVIWNFRAISMSNFD
ncbi:MAG: hypothetical protein AB1422_13515, partial [bacterium]